MAGIRKIYRDPKEGKNYYVVDASFLINKYIPPNRAKDPAESRRIEKCLQWWEEIDTQLSSNKARVYIPDICIAETFKSLARKWYVDRWFRDYNAYRRARGKLKNDVTTPPSLLRAKNRQIKYHDVLTSRDVIIAVDRFFEVFHKKGHNVELPDLIILATAKYLMDFYDIPKHRLHIVTLDQALRDGSTKIQEIPNAYDPTRPQDARTRVFK